MAKRPFQCPMRPFRLPNGSFGIRNSRSASETSFSVTETVVSVTEAAVRHRNCRFAALHGRFGRRTGAKTKGYENECQRRAKVRLKPISLSSCRKRLPHLSSSVETPKTQAKGVLQRTIPSKSKVPCHSTNTVSIDSGVLRLFSDIFQAFSEGQFS